MSKKQYGEWRVIEPIDEGGQTHVFLAEHINGDPEGLYILKRLKNRERLPRLKNEIDARKKIKHPNVVPIVASDLSGKHPYIVEEYFPDGDLERNRSKFEGKVLTCLNLFLDVCRGVKAAHEEGVVHRDLKPGNILYRSSDDSAHITDFGLCFLDDGERHTVFGEQVGSRWYICPEMEQGSIEEPTVACDIYSLGKLLYWMIARKNLARERHREAENDLVLLRGDERLARVNWLLDEMIVEEPDKRLSNIDEVIRRVSEIIKLTEQGFNIIGRGFTQRCIYCGIGTYQEKERWDSKRIEHGASFRIFQSAFRNQAGVELHPDTQFALLLVCDHCGNRQVFVSPPNSGSPWQRESES